MQQNNHPEFIGLNELKNQQHQQLLLFEEWALNAAWQNFHEAHYDWWMFPYDQPSSYGFAYCIFEHETATLKDDPIFMKDFLRGVELQLQAFGWDLTKELWIENPAKDQCWQNWPIRLYKCAASLKQLGCNQEFKSVCKYAVTLIQEGHNFMGFDKDLSIIFTNHAE